MTHETAPGGGAVRFTFPRAGLNFAIIAIVAPRFSSAGSACVRSGPWHGWANRRRCHMPQSN